MSKKDEKLEKGEKKFSKRKREKFKEKNSKNKLFIIGGVILLVVVIVIVAFVMFKKREVKFEHNWQQIYFDYIKLDLIDNGVDSNGKDVFARPYIGMMKKPEVIFIEDDYDLPIMIIRGDLTTGEGEPVCSQSISVSYIKNAGEEQKAVTHLYYSAKDIVYLYNMETKEYNWYIKQESETGNSYTRIIDIIEIDLANEEIVEIENKKLVPLYSFYANSTYNNKKFEEVFIEVEKLSTKYFDIKEDLKISDLKELIINSSEEIKEVDQVLTSEAKEKVEKELAAIEEAKKKAYEEAKKAEEEAKKVAEEAAKKAAEEAKKQAASRLQVGSYTLAYGTYKSLMAEAPLTITLNSGGTCTYIGVDPHSGNDSYNTTCTYKVIHEDIYGYGDMNYGLEFSLANGINTKFVVSSNNAFGSDWLALSHN